MTISQVRVLVLRQQVHREPLLLQSPSASAPSRLMLQQLPHRLRKQENNHAATST
jgi:hypothetical protein